MAVISGDDQKDLKDFVAEYTGEDKEEYTPEDYTNTFCNWVHGGIRSEAGS